MREQKLQYLTSWGTRIQQAVARGALGKDRQQIAINPILGPRAGGLDIYAYTNPAGLKKAMNEAGGLTVANLVPWNFSMGQVNIFSHGKLIRVEAPWPDGLAESNVMLNSIKTNATKVRDAWVSGRDDNGMIVQPGFYLSPHWLIAGETGGGKTVTVTSMVGQLAQASKGSTKFVLIDGKRGEGLTPISHIPHMVGPVAYDMDQATRALNWVVAEMNRRYDVLRTLTETQAKQWAAETPRIVVVVDEIQTLTFDPLLVRTIAVLLQQGRAAKINLVITTQHPTNNILGDNTMKTNLGGRIALKVNSQDTSRVVLGTPEPDASKLLGQGDAYIQAGGVFVRTQIAYLSRSELESIPGGPMDLADWPEPESALTEPVGVEIGRSMVEAPALAEAIIAAHCKEGRPALQKRLLNAGMPMPGASRAQQLMQLGRDIYAYLQQNNYTLR